MKGDSLLLVMVSFLSFFFGVVALMLLGVMFFLVVLLCLCFNFLFLIDLMERVGGMLFVLVMNFLVVLSGFLMMSFMLMMLDGLFGFWLVLFEPCSETLGVVLLLFEFLCEFLLFGMGLLSLFMVVLSMDGVMFVVVAMSSVHLGNDIGTANNSAVSWVNFASVFVVEESIKGAVLFFEISFVLCFFSLSGFPDSSGLFIRFSLGFNGSSILGFLIDFGLRILFFDSSFVFLILFVVFMGLLVRFGFLCEG